MRGADCGDRAHILALPAFWVGLMYDQGALDAAWDLVKGFDAATREGLRVAASEQALQGEAEGVKLLPLAREAVSLALAGLAARARSGASALDETGWLDVLAANIARGRVQADDHLAAMAGQRDLSRLYPAVTL